MPKTMSHISPVGYNPANQPGDWFGFYSGFSNQVKPNAKTDWSLPVDIAGPVITPKQSMLPPIKMLLMGEQQ